MEALILAAGKGTRMGVLTDYLPKTLLHLPGGSILRYQIYQLMELSIQRIFIVTQHKEEALYCFVRKFKESHNKDIRLIHQGAPYNILGAILSAKGYIKEKFIVLHGDNYISTGLTNFIEESEKEDFAVLLTHQAEESSTSVILNQEGYIEKIESFGTENLALTGCYILSANVFPLIEEILTEDTSQDQINLFHKLYKEGSLIKGSVLKGWRQNINTGEDLLKVSERILAEWDTSFHPEDADNGYDPKTFSHISPTATLKDTRIGPFVSIGDSSLVEGSNLSRTIVLPNSHLKKRKVVNSIVIGENIFKIGTKESLEIGG
jgi:glucose-1-phosphate thymidylyltransferase